MDDWFTFLTTKFVDVMKDPGYASVKVTVEGVKRTAKVVESPATQINSDYASALKELRTFATNNCPGDDVPYLESILKRLNLTWRDSA